MYAVRFALVALVACHGNASTPPAQQAPSTPAPAPPPSPPASATASGARDITKPCSMISAEEVSSIVGFAVTSVDEGFRCKFPDAKNGWLSVQLMEASLRSASEICDYARDKRTVVAGVGDSTSYFGSTVCTRLGDVAIIVDGANVAEHSAQLGKSGADNVFVQIAKVVAGRVP